MTAMRMRVVLGVFVGAVAICLSPIADAGTPKANLPYHNDFAHGCGAWVQGEDGTATYGCSNGSYVVKVVQPNADEFIRLFDASPVQSLTVAADVSADSATSKDAVGLGCWHNKESGYLFLITGDRSGFGVERAIGVRYTLLKGSSPQQVPARRITHLQATCAVGSSSFLTVDFWINGAHAFHAVDKHGLGAIAGFGFAVVPNTPGAKFVFDNVTATG